MAGERECSVAVVGRAHTGKSSLLAAVQSWQGFSLGSGGEAVRSVLDDGALVIRFFYADAIGGDGESGAKRADFRIPLDEADIILFLVDASRSISSDDGVIAKKIGAFDSARILAMNKTDLLDDADIDAQLEIGNHLGDFEALVPVSAATGVGLDTLIDHITRVARRVVSARPARPDSAS